MRARNLKPSIFKNDLLAVADPLYTLIFEGLWCMADREGRLDDKPVKIHIEVNPCRPFETTEKSLAWLADNGFIVRYQVRQSRYIQVVTFKDHQNPHQKEPPSKIPAPNTSPTPGETGASTGHAQEQNKCGPADSGFLTPDSPSPLPVSLLPEVSGTHEAASIGFHTIREGYPAFTGRQDWITAEHNCHQRIERDGVSWADLVAAVARYRKYCDSGGVSGSQFVMTPGKFFGAADEPWKQAWTPPPTKAQAKQDKNITVAQRWLSRQTDAAQ